MINWILTPLQSWGGNAPVSSDTPFTVALIIVFFGIMVGIGLVASRYQANEVDYYAAGRRSGIFVVAIAGFASIQSGWGFVGNPGAIFSSGYEFLLMNFTAIGFVLGYWLLAKKMRLLGTVKDAITAPDALYYRFGESDHVRLLGAISIFVGSVGYLAAQYAALGIIGAIIFPFGFIPSLIIGLVVVGFYTVIGGSLAAVWSDAIQGIIMIVSAPILFLYIVTNLNMSIGDVTSAVIAQSPNWFHLAILGGNSISGLGYALSVAFISITVTGQPQFTTKFYMIRDVSLLKWGPLITGAGFFVTTLYWFATPWIKAGVATGQFPPVSNPDYALPVALVQSAPEAVVAFILTAIVAAIMSTSNAFLNLAAASIQHDIIQGYYGRDITDQQEVRRGRIITVIVLAGAFILAATFPNIILVLGAAGWALMASVIFPGVAIAYNWKGATREGIIAGGWIALIGTIVLAFGGQYLGIALPFGLFGGQTAGFIGLVVFVVVSLLTNTAEYDDLTDDDIKSIISAGRLGDSTSTTNSRVPLDDD